MKFFPPSDVLMKVVGSVVIVCLLCTRKVQVNNIKTHLTTKCGAGVSGVNMSVDDILSQPLTTPLSRVEQNVAYNVVKRMIKTGKKRDSVSLPTAGEVRSQLIR